MPVRDFSDEGDPVHLLVTRPRAEAERTAQALRALGHDAIIAPMLTIEPLRDVSIGDGPWSGIIMTSGNAARAISGHASMLHLQDLPVFAVGRQTAQAAREAGFASVTSADGDAGDLATLLAARVEGSKTPLLYLAGNDRARDLPGDLAAQGIPVTTIVIYRAIAATAFSDVVRVAIAEGRLDGVLHYSRRTAAIFADCAAAAGMTDAIAALTHYCLSRRAAEPLVAIGAPVRVPAHPDEAALLGLIAPAQ